jgi:hypothetical protein
LIHVPPPPPHHHHHHHHRHRRRRYRRRRHHHRHNKHHHVVCCSQETEPVRNVAAALVKTHMAVDLGVGASEERKKAALHGLQKIAELMTVE